MLIRIRTKNNKSEMPIRPLVLSILLSSSGMLALLGTTVAAAAGFSTNFQKPNGWTTQDTGGCGFAQCTSEGGNLDPSPFAETIVTISGVTYYHVIVGDPAAGFAQESYTRAAAKNIQGGNEIGGLGGGFGLDGGGNLYSVIGNTTPTNNDTFDNKLNNSNSLGDYRVSGTGGNAPDYSVFRMVMTSPSGDMSMEVYKPFLDKKPLITQTVQDGGMTSTFVADERALTYSDASTAAPVINTLTLNDPSIPGGSATTDFSMAKAQQSIITAGRFTYDRPANYGWNDPVNGWDSPDSTFVFGTYNYVGGQGFDPLNYDWSQVFDYSQNALYCAAISGGNQWTRDDNGVFGGSCFNKP
jgi:hypothetical protein